MVNRFNATVHHRRSIRLKGYDYASAGAYFVTVCAHNRECLFGEVRHGNLHLNEYGRVVHNEWMKTARIRREIELGDFAIMPNHIHAIVMMVTQSVGAYGHTPLRSPSKTLGAMVRGFKSAVTKQINKIRKTPGTKVWQRNYFEHIIRDDADYHRILAYIAANPQQWEKDQSHPDRQFQRSRAIGIGTPGVRTAGGVATIVGAYGHTPLRNCDDTLCKK